MWHKRICSLPSTSTRYGQSSSTRLQGQKHPPHRPPLRQRLPPHLLLPLPLLPRRLPRRLRPHRYPRNRPPPLPNHCTRLHQTHIPLLPLSHPCHTARAHPPKSVMSLPRPWGRQTQTSQSACNPRLGARKPSSGRQLQPGPGARSGRRRSSDCNLRIPLLPASRVPCLASRPPSPRISAVQPPASHLAASQTYALGTDLPSHALHMARSHCGGHFLPPNHLLGSAICMYVFLL